MSPPRARLPGERRASAAAVALAVLVVLVVLVALAPRSGAAAGGGARQGERPDPFARVAVVGASVSAGFGLRAELKAAASLADFVQCALPEASPGGPRAVLDLGQELFFTRPTRLGSDAVARAREADPTLVVALDFLFWYGYGDLREDARLERLEDGLRALEALPCPVLVGDLPDMTIALEGAGPFGQPMIRPAQIPRPETLTLLNARLRAWAAGRESVVVVPLCDYVARLASGREVRLRGNEWPPDAVARLTQADRLHPTVEGTAALTVLALDALVTARELGDDAVRWEVAGIVERIRAATAAERRASEEKERAREERLRKLRERRREESEGEGGAPSRWSSSRLPAGGSQVPRGSSSSISSHSKAPFLSGVRRSGSSARAAERSGLPLRSASR